MKQLLTVFFITIIQSSVFAQIKAFPEAEGFGRFATGGRGGKVYEVTNLNDSGPGSFRAGFDAFPGEPLTIVFKVGGIIDLLSEIKIKRSNITIAGQTAPGDGICLRGNSFIVNGARANSQGGNHGNIIIRYIRSRPGSTKPTGVYGFGMENCQNVIIDHCSFSWANEECAAMYDTKNVTVQWSIVSEGLYNAGHAKGVRSYGGVWGGQYASYHHNLIANNNSRTIRFNGARAHDTIAVIDYRNNVVYNSGGSGAAYGGEVEIPGGVSEVNIVNNYYKPGPAASSLLFVEASYNASLTKGTGQWYVSGNVMNGNAGRTSDNWTGVDLGKLPAADQPKARSNNPFAVSGAAITMQTAQAAYESVLQNAGALLPLRDAVDKRIVSETATGTASVKGKTSGKYGIIDSPAEVGGWPVYKSGTATTDSDKDGMPDAWEIQKGLNPNDPADRNSNGTDGYTMLEAYLNTLAAVQTSPSILQGFALLPKAGSETAVELKWAALNDEGIEKYYLERSTDSILFVQIAEIPAEGQTSLREYSFTDEQTPGDQSWYRLKFSDKKGNIIYSDILSFYRVDLKPYWTEPFTTTTVSTIDIPATVTTSVQSNGEWILYGARKDERSVTSADPANQWATGSLNPTLLILNNNAATAATYSLTEAPYFITPVLNKGVSKISFHEIQRASISAGSIVIYTSADSGRTWSSTGISNPAKSALFDLLTININDPAVNRLKITKPAGVTMSLDNLTVYEFASPKKDQNISFAPLPAKMVGDLDFSLSATSGSGLPVTFSSSDTSVVRIKDGLVHITGPGRSIITALQAGDAEFKQVRLSRELKVNAVRIKARYRDNDNRQAFNNTIRHELEILNEGDTTVALNGITARYWFTPENYNGINTSIDYIQKSGVLASAVYIPSDASYKGALGYVEYRFGAASASLLPAAGSGIIRGRFNNKDYALFDETDDHSYLPASSWMDNDKITLYRNGILVWGKEPLKTEPLVKLSILSQNRNNAANGNMIRNIVVLQNEGNIPLAYEDLSLRYWFSAEGTSALNFWTDYAKLGSSNITGTFSNSFLELKIKPSAGTLYPLSNTGEMQYRFAKADWSAFNESNDHSYKPAAALAPNENITVYYKGQLVYGTEPSGFPANSLSVSERLQSGKPDASAGFSSVYPNPVNDNLFINIVKDTAGTSNIKLYNLQGILVKTDDFAGTNAALNMIAVPAGWYVLHLTNGGKTETFTLRKE